MRARRNHRNGYSKKSVLTGTSKMTLSVPRDRAGTFDPKLIAKYQRRFPDFDEKIISMYARGMTVREIRGHLEELYGIDVSPDLISAVTDAVLDEVAEWQNRPLDICYPLVFFDAIRVKVRDEGFVRNKAIYIALGVLPDGTKEILGIWIEQTEGAKFWLRVDERTKEPRRPGHSDRRRRRPEGLSRSHQCRFPADGRSDLHRPPDPPFHGFCLLEGSQERRAGACGPSIARPMPLLGQAALDAFAQSPWGAEVSGNRAELAPQLGACHSVLRFPRRRAAKLSTPRMPSRR